ncbi:Retinoblastoma-binding protein 5 [Lamellibrachia satsuma]|nr:Retinoblastoma-binding protein 5 [Lamellibrachia satsuma]
MRRRYRVYTHTRWSRSPLTAEIIIIDGLDYVSCMDAITALRNVSESFGQNFPEDIDGTLDCVSIAITCAFNRRGTLLAVGCNDGRIAIWDFLTRGIASIISAHVHPVCSLSWNRNGRKLLSTATDNTVSIWDVETGECDKTFRFPSPVIKAQFHPRDSTKLLVCPMKHPTVLMTIDGHHQQVPLDEENDLNVVASFDRRGQNIYTGNSKGMMLVYETDTMKVAASFRVTTGTSNTTAIKSIEFARRGNCFLVNSADRVIRVYESGEVLACGKGGEPEPVQKLQDLVNKSLWKKCCFSGDGEYVAAGSARQHSLYIWEKSIGNLVKILHGTKGEMLLDLVWHPVRPIIASISNGIVSVWAQNQVENWSAFAPDFKELDENVEYEEHESEFDIEDEDKEVEETKCTEEEDIEVDVTSVDVIPAFLSSDEEADDPKVLLFLPVSPDMDELEEGYNGDQDEVAVEAVEKKRSSLSKDSSSPPKKKKQQPVIEVDLPNAPVDEMHPLLCVKKPADRQQHRRSNSSRSKSSHRSSHSRSDSKSRHRADKASRGHDSSRSAADATHKENAAGSGQKSHVSTLSDCQSAAWPELP